MLVGEGRIPSRKHGALHRCDRRRNPPTLATDPKVKRMVLHADRISPFQKVTSNGTLCVSQSAFVTGTSPSPSASRASRARPQQRRSRRLPRCRRSRSRWRSATSSREATPPRAAWPRSRACRRLGRFPRRGSGTSSRTDGEFKLATDAFSTLKPIVVRKSVAMRKPSAVIAIALPGSNAMTTFALPTPNAIARAFFTKTGASMLNHR